MSNKKGSTFIWEQKKHCHEVDCGAPLQELIIDFSKVVEKEQFPEALDPSMSWNNPVSVGPPTNNLIVYS